MWAEWTGLGQTQHLYSARLHATMKPPPSPLHTMKHDYLDLALVSPPPITALIRKPKVKSAWQPRLAYSGPTGSGPVVAWRSCVFHVCARQAPHTAAVAMLHDVRSSAATRAR